MSGGRIPEPVIDDIRGRSDIVAVVDAYVPLKKRGADYWACCPFHKEKSPSFKVSASHQAYYCFGCHKSGNVFNFVMELENTDFPGAVRLLAQRCGVVIPEEPLPGRGGDGAADGAPRPPKERLYDLLLAVSRWYQQQLRERGGEPAREYLRGRVVPDDVAVAFGLGYSPDSWDATLKWGDRQGYDADLMVTAGLAVPREDSGPRHVYDRFRGRLMFPICDELGRVVGFSARVLSAQDQGAKYINTPETPVFHKGRLLYAFHLARQALKTHGTALVCEGQLDVIACHRAGLTHAVAPQGTAFTDTHAQLLRRHTDTVTLAFDGDPAGEKAAVRSVQVALEAGLKVRVVALPKGDDPDSLYRTRGPEALQAAMGAAQDAFAFLLGIARAHHDAATPDGKVGVVREVLEAVAAVPNPVARAAYCQWLAGQVALPESAVHESLGRLARERRRPEPVAAGAAAATAAGARPAAPAKPRSGPVAAGLPVVERAQLMLLDLAVHHAVIAQQLAERLPPDVTVDSPVSQALHRVIDLTASDQWSEAGRRLAADPALAQVPEIARVLMAPEFPAPATPITDPTEQDRLDARLLKAAADCLAQLEKHCLETEIRRLDAQLAEVVEPDAKRALLHQYQALVRQRNQLGPQTRG